MTIADVKTSQITQWRNERLSHAEVLSGNSIFADMVKRWIMAPGIESTGHLRQYFGVLSKHYGYSNVFLLGTDGYMHMRLNPAASALSPDVAELVHKAITTGKPLHGEVHFYADESAPHIDFIVPIFDFSDRKRPAIGAVLLQADPNNFLFPLLQSWPYPSTTSETLLVRQDGDEVLYINELRHIQDTSLKMRRPLSESNLPAAQAIRGREGIFDGLDHRGHEVIAALKPVPATGWFLVAKTDRSEALATARMLAAEGWNYSVGLAQINARNFERLGLTVESAFEPCANLTAMQAVLTECFERADARNGSQQRSLRQALSCYYSGNFVTGFQHGYVRKVVRSAIRTAD